jgi:O-antigen/teichoic acid export membrane protein
MVFGDCLLVTWMGPGYESAASLLLILSIPTLFALPQSAAASMLFGLSRHRGVVVLALLNALVNLGLSIWWVKVWKLEGVALGTAVPLLLIGGVATAIYAVRALEMPFWRYAWEGFARPGLASLTFLIPALAIRLMWRPIGWGPLILAVAASWLIFVVFAWRFGFTSSERERWGQVAPRVFGLRRSGRAVPEASS